MALAFVGSYVGTHAAVSSQSVAFSNLRDEANAQPTLQQGDLVVVAVNCASTVDRTEAQLLPSGYTVAHADLYQNDSNDVNLLVSYKVMGASPDANVSIPASNATTAGVAYAIYVFRGVDTANPLDVTSVTAGNINTGVANAAAITPSTSGAWIMAVGAAAVAAGAVFTNPAGMSGTTNHFRSATITSTTNDANIGVALKTDWAAGAFDPAVFGGSTSTNTGSWAAVTIVLRPLVASGTATGSVALAGSTAGTVAIAASASGSVELSGGGTASVAILAQGSGSLALSGLSDGSVAGNEALGTASGSLAFSGSAVASAALAGAVSGSFGLSGSASAQVALVGASSGSLGLTGSSTSTLAIAAASVGSLSLVGNGSASVAINGDGGSEVIFTGTAQGAVGNVPIEGVANGSFDLSGAAEAAALIAGAANDALALVGSASGIASNPVEGEGDGELLLAGQGLGILTLCRQYGLAGRRQSYPSNGRHSFPLSGRSQSYPLRRAA